MSIAFCAMDSLLLQFGHGLEDDACCGMRCVWAPVDTGDQEKALELSFKELPFHVVDKGGVDGRTRAARIKTGRSRRTTAKKH